MNKQKLEEDIKKRRTNPYISKGYEDIPVVNLAWVDDWNKYVETMSGRLVNPEGKDIPKKCCSEPKKYRNGFGKTVFWSCKNCGADLGDIND